MLIISVVLTRRKLFTFQNNDIPLKTNYETVEILKALNGSNDVNVGPPNKNRIPQNLSWTYQALNLFKGEVSLISYRRPSEALFIYNSDKKRKATRMYFQKGEKTVCR